MVFFPSLLPLFLFPFSPFLFPLAHFPFPLAHFPLPLALFSSLLPLFPSPSLFLFPSPFLYSRFTSFLLPFSFFLRFFPPSPMKAHTAPPRGGGGDRILYNLELRNIEKFKFHLNKYKERSKKFQ